jgi:hypothetical protein
MYICGAGCASVSDSVGVVFTTPMIVNHSGAPFSWCGLTLMRLPSGLSP